MTFTELLPFADASTWRPPDDVVDVSDVREIIDDVRRCGDAEIDRLALMFGDEPLREVPRDEWGAAFHALLPPLRDALRFAHESIASFARQQLASLRTFSTRAHDLRISQRIVPIDRVGVYVPGGRHPLPSTALMCVTPARVAGVGNIVVCTPKPTPEVLAAAYVAGASRLFVAGGPQAIAAMAYGTQTIPRVDMLVGPGNAYVTEAKRLVFGACGIDTLAGPSEIMVVALGADADARLVALDLVAQAEHDPASRVMLVCDREEFAQAVRGLLITDDPVAREALRRGATLLVGDAASAVRIADRLAPEHLVLHGSGAEAMANRFSHMGALFVGSHAAQVFGDYASGPNHVLPTGGAARFSSALSPLRFVCVRIEQRAGTSAAASLIDATAALAGCEGLVAHQAAALARKH